MDFLVTFSSFISQGDYGLPFDLIEYIYKNFYIWSFQNGGANLDGILRAPGRVIVTVFFAIFGNLAASYFYLALSYGIVAVSMFLFIRYFLEKKNVTVSILFSLMFMLSPAFLGNTSKIGLVAAAALLPVCLLLVRLFFKHNKILYLFLLIITLGYSLLHPFTFTVNIVLSLIYFLYCLLTRYSILKVYLKNIFICLPFAVLLNAYFLLPVISVGSIDKAALSQDSSSQQVDYSNIIEIANAGSPLAAFTQAKSVFIDYYYFNEHTLILFTAGALLSLALPMIIIVRHLYRIDTRFKMITLASLMAYLILIFMSSGHELASQLFKFLVNIPGGWIFRSPLKWQLYMPFFLTVIAVVAYIQISQRRFRYIFLILLALASGLQSFFLMNEIYNKLLTPKNVTSLTELANIKSHSTLLYVSGLECARYLTSNSQINSEINQSLNSKQVFVTRTSETNISDYRLDQYDYIFTCKINNKSVTDDLKYHSLDFFENKQLSLVQLNEHNDINLVKNLYKIENISELSRYTSFASKLSDNYSFTSQDAPEATKLNQIFGNISSSSITNSGINVEKQFGDNNYSFQALNDLYYRLQDDTLELTDRTDVQGFSVLKSMSKLELDNSITNFKYISDKRVINSLDNGTFESALWSPTVNDCYNYDNDPLIKMSRKTDSNPAIGNYLELSARRHIACTQKAFNINDTDSNILLNFDYKTAISQSGSYTVNFYDNNSTKISAITSSVYGDGTSTWQNVSRTLTVPKNAIRAEIVLYGYPDPKQEEYLATSYDNINIYPVPKSLTGIFLSETSLNMNDTAELAIKVNSPVSQTIAVSQFGKNEMIMIKTKEAYNGKWSIKINQAVAHDGVSTIQLDNNSLGILINPKKVCMIVTCEAGNNGTTNMTVSLDYTPQKYFIIGSIVSIVSFVVLLIYSVKQLRRPR